MERGDLSPMVGSPARSTSAAFTAAACALGVAFIGSNLPTPLYPVYQARWHFSAGIVTIIFAAYSLGLIVALVGFGRLSDQLGRRPLLVTALAILLGASLIFLFAPGVAWLVLARVSQRLGVGAAAATASAALAGYEPTNNQRRAALVASMATAIGLALGPTFVISALHIDNRALGGFVGSLVFATSALVQVIVRRSAIRGIRLLPAMTLGSICLIVGLVICVFALTKASIAIFLGGVLLVGGGQGVSYFASLAALNVVAPPARRGEIIAAYYLVGYTCIAFAIPAVGFASARVGLPAACSAFTVAIGFLAAASTAIACLYSRQVPFAQQP
jgi:hypothetical protein